jgi:hypothetical protein
LELIPRKGSALRKRGAEQDTTDDTYKFILAFDLFQREWKWFNSIPQSDTSGLKKVDGENRRCIRPP